MPLLGAASGLALTVILVATIVVVIVRIRKQEDCSTSSSVDSRLGQGCAPGQGSPRDDYEKRHPFEDALETKLLPLMPGRHPASPRNPDVIPEAPGSGFEHEHLVPSYIKGDYIDSGVLGTTLPGQDSLGMYPESAPNESGILRAGYQLNGSIPGLDGNFEIGMGNFGNYEDSLGTLGMGSDPSTRKYEQRNFGNLGNFSTPGHATGQGGQVPGNQHYTPGRRNSFFSQTLPRRPLMAQHQVSGAIYVNCEP